MITITEPGIHGIGEYAIAPIEHGDAWPPAEAPETATTPKLRHQVEECHCENPGVPCGYCEAVALYCVPQVEAGVGR